MNLLFDSRDSTINAYRGMYASISYQWNPHLVREHPGQLAPVRQSSGTYLGLSDAVPRNVLAFWVDRAREC